MYKDFQNLRVSSKEPSWVDANFTLSKHWCILFESRTVYK